MDKMDFESRPKVLLVENNVRLIDTRPLHSNSVGYLSLSILFSDFIATSISSNLH